MWEGIRYSDAMMSNVTKSLAVATGGVLLASVAVAPAAMAYPPGNKVEVFTNKPNYKPRATVKVQASQLQRGCKVRVRIEGFDFQRQRVVTASRTRINTSINGPSRTGRYRAIVTTFGSGCVVETSRTVFWVR